MGDGHGKDSREPALAVGGLVTVAAHVPGEDAHLVVVEGHAVVVFGEHHEVLGNFFVAVGHLVKHEGADDALAFSVLSDVERDINIHHAGQHPAHAAIGVAHQPPVFERRLGRHGFAADIFAHGNGGGLRLGGGGTLENLHLGAGFELIEVLRIAIGSDVNVGVVIGGAGGHDGSVAVVGGHLFHLIKDVLPDEITLFDPAFFAFGSADAHK